MDIETIIIGAGVVGLSIAKSLSEIQEVVLLEKNKFIADETSSRNSEVIHAGIYYPPNSLKAKFCVEGKKLLYVFCEKYNIPFKKLGKIIVAQNEYENIRLNKLFENAKCSGVNDLRLLEKHDLKVFEPELTGINGFFSPSTGIIDSHSYYQVLEGLIASNGGMVLTQHKVINIRYESGRFVLLVASGRETFYVSCKNLINAAGLYASKVANLLTGYPNTSYRVPETSYAKGHYYQFSGQAPFSHLIYPIPPKSSLGIHLTFDYSSRAKFGPDLEWVKNIDYKFENLPEERRLKFEEAIRYYWPGLPANSLHEAYTGIRPKIESPAGAFADFAIHYSKQHGIKRLVHLFGIESPGLTSSLAVGNYIKDLLEAI